MGNLTWTRNASGQYTASNGARVYLIIKKSFVTEWGVQLPHWPSGDGGFTSMREAREFVERHSN